MRREHEELIYAVAAGWAWAFICLFALWLFAVTSLVPKEDAGVWLTVLILLGAGAVTGMSYLAWYLNREVPAQGVEEKTDAK